MSIVVIHKHNAEQAGLHYDFRFANPGENNAISIVLRDNPETFLKNGYSKNTVYTIEDKSVLKIKDLIITEGYGKGKIELVDKFNANITKHNNKIDIVFDNKKITVILFSEKYCRFITNEPD